MTTKHPMNAVHLRALADTLDRMSKSANSDDGDAGYFRGFFTTRPETPEFHNTETDDPEACWKVQHDPSSGEYYATQIPYSAFNAPLDE